MATAIRRSRVYPWRVMSTGHAVRIRGRSVQQLNDSIWRDRQRHPDLYAGKRFTMRGQIDGSVIVRRVE